jgi:hypothetical protein
MTSNNPFYQRLVLELDKIGYRIHNYICLWSNNFNVNISYGNKKNKTCIINFKQDTDVAMMYYDFINKNQNKTFTYHQDINEINIIVDNVKMLLE